MASKCIEIPAAIIKIESFAGYKKVKINGEEAGDYILKLLESFGDIQEEKEYVLYHSSENFILDPSKVNYFGGTNKND